MNGVNVLFEFKVNSLRINFIAAERLKFALAFEHLKLEFDEEIATTIFVTLTP